MQNYNFVRGFDNYVENWKFTGCLTLLDRHVIVTLQL